MMSNHRYTTALSHLVLAGTSFYCLTKINHSALSFPHGTYGIIFINSIIGLWRWGNPEYGHKVDRFYRFTTFLQTICSLPCITTTIWLGYGYEWSLAVLHTAVSLVPLVAYLSDKAHGEMVDSIVGINALSLGIVTFMQQNYFGVAAAVSHAFNHFTIRNEGTFMDIPALDMYNYGMCFFVYFALRALGDGTGAP